MNNNKKEMKMEKENSVKVLVSLPEKVHKALKVEAIMKKNGNQKKVNLQGVLIQRLERDLQKHPFQISI